MVTFTPVLKRRVVAPTVQPKKASSTENLFLASAKPAKTQQSQLKHTSKVVVPPKHTGLQPSLSGKPSKVVIPPKRTALHPKYWCGLQPKQQMENKSVSGSVKTESRPVLSTNQTLKQTATPAKKSSSIKLPTLQPNKIFPKLFRGGRVSSLCFSPVYPRSMA